MDIFDFLEEVLGIKLQDFQKDMVRRRIEKHIETLRTTWNKHLEEDGGSCYCLASDTSCIPQVITELKKLIGKDNNG